MNKNDVTIIQKKTVYQGFFRMVKYRLRFRLFAGGWSHEIERELFERGHAVAVLPYDPVLDKVVLVEQLRVGALQGEDSPWLIELIAGMIDANEPADKVARREAKEEANLELLDLAPIYDYWVSPGGTSEKVILFCARVNAADAGGIHGLAKEHEDIRVFNLPIQQAFAAVESGKINNAATIIALQWLQLNHDELRRRWA